MRTRYGLFLLLSCALGVPDAARADESAIAREIDAALVRLADRDELQPVTIRRPARTLHELGAVVDVRSPDARGLPVLAVTPGGAAARIGLRRGDRVLKVNAVQVATAPQPAAALRRALSSDAGRLQLGVRRGKQELALRGVADTIVLPAYTLTLASAAPGTMLARCGRISTMDTLPRAQLRFPVVVIAIDGRTPPSDGEVVRLPPGKHRLVLAERIDNDRFGDVQRKQRDALGRRAYKTLELDVAADTTYQLAASLDPPGAARVADGNYWRPVVHRAAPERCR